MTFPFRTVTHGVLDWRGILIQVTLEKQRFVDHLQIETLDPIRAPLPITETGYRSHFIAKDLIEQAGGPAAYLEAWLDHAATAKGWAAIEDTVRQYELL
jgi:hypothetical protein